MTADGWVVSSTGGAVSWAQVANPFSPPRSVNALKITGASGVTDAAVRFPIEGVLAARLASQTVTFQLSVQNNSGASITPTLTVKHAGSADNWASPTTDVSAQALQTIANGASGVLSYTFACAAGAVNGLSITVDFGGSLNGAGASVTVGLADIRIAGTVWNPHLRNASIEWLLCQRYLPGFFGDASSQFLGHGAVQTSTTADVGFQFAVPARASVTGISASAASTFGFISGGSVTACTSIAWNQGGRTGAGVQIGITGMTANQATQLWTLAASTFLLFTGAEILGA